MSINITGVTLTRPTVTQNIGPSGSFIFGVQLVTSGAGGWAESADIHFQWDQGSASWVDIGGSGALYTSDTNPVNGLQSTAEQTVTVVNDGTAGTFHVRGYVVEDDLTEYYTASIEIDVTAPVVDLVVEVESASSTSSATAHSLRNILSDIAIISTAPDNAIGQDGAEIDTLFVDGTENLFVDGVENIFADMGYTNLSAKINGTSSTPGAISRLLLSLSCAIESGNSTSTITSHILRDLVVNLSAHCQTSTISILLQSIISLLAEIDSTSFSSDSARTLFRDIAANPYTTTTTPDISAFVSGIISLIANVTAESEASGISTILERALAASINVASSTPNIVSSLASVIGLVADIVAGSNSNEINVSILRNLLLDSKSISTTSSALVILSRTILAEILAESSTSGIGQISSRDISSDIHADSITSTALSKSMRSLLVDIIGKSTTHNAAISISGLIVLLSKIVGASQTTAISPTTLRSILAEIGADSTTPESTASLLRYLTAQLATESIISDVSVHLLRLVSVIISGTSASSESQIKFLRGLTAEIDGSSLTPNVSAIIAGIVSLLANIIIASSSGSASANLLIDFNADIQSESQTPNTLAASLETVISLISDITGTSVTPDAELIIHRFLTVDVDAHSQVALLSVNILRNLIGFVDADSSTPYILATAPNLITLAAMVAGVSISSEIATNISRTLSVLLSGQSVTPDVSASVARMLLAEIDGTSITANDLIVVLTVLGDISNPSSSTISKTYGSTTKANDYTTSSLTKDKTTTTH